MSDVSNTVFATGAIVVIGRWATDESLNVKIVTGGLFLALMLTAIANADENFARLFADLLLVSAIFTYGLPISRLIAITTGPATKSAPTKPKSNVTAI
jgi:hypothetical protein